MRSRRRRRLSCVHHGHAHPTPAAGRAAPAGGGLQHAPSEHPATALGRPVRRSVRLRWVGCLLALALLGCGLGDGTALGLLPAEIDDGVHVRPLPMGAPAAAVSLAEMVGSSRGEAEERAAIAARRVIAQPAPAPVCGGPPEGSLGPGQPRWMCWLTHHGKMVDDQTGAILYSFNSGRFIGSPAGSVIWVTDPDGRLAWFRILPPE